MKKTDFLYKCLITGLISAFLSTSLYFPQADAGEITTIILPKPGSMVHLSPAFTPAYLKGISIHPEDALKFDFIIYKGDEHLTQDEKKIEYKKLIKYFLASLAVPDHDQWVNLSPYEKDRIIENDFGKTEMGRDLLAQDYLLKQITSSLIYPEKGLGKEFWREVYAKAYQKYGQVNIPINTFNKVWIIPDKAVVYEKGDTAYVLENHLKVMLQEDYLSLSRHAALDSDKGPSIGAHAIASSLIRTIILPAIEKEVNEGENFAPLRQVYSGMLLATWYKRALKESLLGKIYANKAKLKGIDQRDTKDNERIYQQYLQAFKRGVYNYIKEDIDASTQQRISRKYFSGGTEGYEHTPLVFPETINPAQSAGIAEELSDEDTATAVFDAAMLPDKRQARAREVGALGVKRSIADQFFRLERKGKKKNLSPQIMGLILHFRDKPGIERVMDGLEKIIDGKDLDQSRILGIGGELYHAYLLEQDGYEVMAFQVGITNIQAKSHDVLVEIDVLVKKKDRFYFVEVKHFNGRISSSQYLEPELWAKRWLLKTEKRKDVIFRRYQIFINDIIRSNDKEVRGTVRKQLEKQLGVILAGELISQLENIHQPVDFIFSATRNVFVTFNLRNRGLIYNKLNQLIPFKQDYLINPKGVPWIDRDKQAITDVITTAARMNGFHDLIVLYRPYTKFNFDADSELPREKRSEIEPRTSRKHDPVRNGRKKSQKGSFRNPAQSVVSPTGGIDFNAANLDLMIKRDGHGIPLPVALQDMAQLNRIEGLVPRILEISPTVSKSCNLKPI